MTLTPTRLLPVFLLFSLNIQAAQNQKPFGQIQEEQKFKDYTVRIYRNEQDPPDSDKNPDHQDGFGCFEILRSGRQVYFQKGIIFKVGMSANEDTTFRTPVIMGQCILGDKQPDLVITEISGGNNDFCDYYVFQISDTFKFITKITNTGGGEFKDLRGDGNFDLITSDPQTFFYWEECGHLYPHPTIIYRYQYGKYRLDLEKMKTTAPSKQELEKLAKELKAKFGGVYIPYRACPLPGDNTVYADNKWAAPNDLFSEMLDLIYSGNMESAWKLCNLSWPVKHPGKANFLKEFINQLQTSPYYNDINQASFQGVAVHKN